MLRPVYLRKIKIVPVVTIDRLSLTPRHQCSAAAHPCPQKISVKRPCKLVSILNHYQVKIREIHIVGQKKFKSNLHAQVSSSKQLLFLELLSLKLNC